MQRSRLFLIQTMCISQIFWNRYISQTNTPGLTLYGPHTFLLSTQVSTKAMLYNTITKLMLSFISTQKQLNLCSRHWMQSLIICNLPAVQLCFTNSLFFYNYIVSILREEKTIEEQPPGNHIHFIPFILIQSLGSTPAGQIIMFGENCSI